HRLRGGTQLLGHRRDRFPLRSVLVLMIEHHPHRPLTQLGRVSPMSWHNSILPKDRSLHKTRGGSQPKHETEPSDDEPRPRRVCESHDHSYGHQHEGYHSESSARHPVRHAATEEEACCDEG